MDRSDKKEILVTIITSLLVIITIIVMGIITMQKEVQQVIINTPELEKVDFVQYFGLKKNKTFHFTKRTLEGNSTKESNEQKIQVKIVDEIKTENGVLFILNNDLLNPSLNESNSGILIVSNLVFFLDELETENIKKYVTGKKVDFDKNSSTYLEKFILPFFHGQKFGGDIFDYVRKDNKYSYYVQKEGSSNFFDGEKVIERQRYRLYFVTLPDTSYIEFIPYVGIVSLNFHHNGSKNEEIVELIKVEN